MTGSHRFSRAAQVLRSDNLVDHLPIVWFGIGAFGRPRPNADIVKLLQARCDVDCTGSADAEATMVA